MKHIVQLLLKFVFTVVILEIILLLTTQLGFWQILLISLVVTVIGYIGDLMIPRRTGNTVATICDLVLATLIVFLFSLGPGVYKTISFWNALLSGLLIAVSEWFFHRYLLKNSEDKG